MNIIGELKNSEMNSFYYCVSIYIKDDRIALLMFKRALNPIGEEYEDRFYRRG